MHESVLAHVASTIPQKENLATSALVYILNRSQPARRALHATFERVVGNLTSIETLQIEETLDDGKRPDVLLLDADGQRVGFVEVKFWAGLTEAQPVHYLDALRDGGGEVLVFLAPARRLASLRNEIIERCVSASLDVDHQAEDALVCGGIRVALIAWAEVLEQLGRSTVDDRQTLADVEQLRGLCERVEGEGQFSLTREEVDDLATPQRYLMLAALASEAVERWVAVGTGSVKGLRTVPLSCGPGRYVHLGRVGAWLGLDHESWAEYGRSPIWLRVAPTEWSRGTKAAQALTSWIRATPPRAYREGPGKMLLIPVMLPAAGTKEEAIARILDLIRELEQHLDAAGLPLIALPSDA